MWGDIFNNSDFIEHNDLRYESDRFKPETVAPHEFPSVPATIDNQSQNESCRKQYFQVREIVAHYIISLESVNMDENKGRVMWE